jgi:hypothetical protein
MPSKKVVVGQLNQTEREDTSFTKKQSRTKFSNSLIEVFIVVLRFNTIENKVCIKIE